MWQSQHRKIEQLESDAFECDLAWLGPPEIEELLGPASIDPFRSIVGVSGWNDKVDDDTLSRLADVTTIRSIVLNFYAAKPMDRLFSWPNFTSTGIERLATLGDLTVLRILDGSTDDATVEPLQRLRNLEVLELEGGKRVTEAGGVECRLTDQGLSYLQNLTKLKRLSLSGTRVTDKGLIHLRKMTDLRELDLIGTSVRGSGLAQLEHLSLERIDLSSLVLDSMALVHVSRLRTLTHLRLANTNITDAQLHYLYELPHLESLDLAGTNVTDQGVESFVKHNALKYLNLHGTQVSSVAVENLRQACGLEIILPNGLSTNDGDRAKNPGDTQE